MSGQKIIDGLRDVMQSVRQDYIHALQDIEALDKLAHAGSFSETYSEKLSRESKRQMIQNRIEQIDAVLSDG
ncbi:MAG: hypothetical protein RIA64_07525 [Rhodospirillales bacterium]